MARKYTSPETPEGIQPTDTWSRQVTWCQPCVLTCYSGHGERIDWVTSGY